MGDTAVRVEALSKRYRIGVRAARYDTLRDRVAEGCRAMLGPSRRRPASADKDAIWALKDVSFEVRRGEVLGIIGRNGAGKSTLLKILSRITEPTEGRVELAGRVGSLLEVGTGFHGELTGRENVYLSGAILGMRKTEIDRKFDEIVHFAEVETFIDTPVKRYSSGMYLRLAFAVAAHLEPEILIVDEVLAVGDAAFQKKCLGKMEHAAHEGRTVLFVSHNMPSVQALCQRVLLFQAGKLEMDGAPDHVVSHYLLQGEALQATEVDLSRHHGRSHSREPALRRARVGNGAAPSNCLMMGGTLEVSFEFEASRPVRDPGFGIAVEDEHGRPLFYLSNYLVRTASNTFRSLAAGTVSVRVPNLPLVPGTYFLNLTLAEQGREWVDHVERALAIHVQPAPVYGVAEVPTAADAVFFVSGEVAVTPRCP